MIDPALLLALLLALRRWQMVLDMGLAQRRLSANLSGCVPVTPP